MQTSTFYTNWETPSFTKEDYKNMILEIVAAEVEEDLAAPQYEEEDMSTDCPYECFDCPFQTCLH